MEHRVHAVYVLCAPVHCYNHELECFADNVLTLVEDWHHGIRARPSRASRTNVCRQVKCSCTSYVGRCLFVHTTTVYGQIQLSIHTDSLRIKGLAYVTPLGRNKDRLEDTVRLYLIISTWALMTGFCFCPMEACSGNSLISPRTKEKWKDFVFSL